MACTQIQRSHPCRLPEAGRRADPGDPARPVALGRTRRVGCGFPDSHADGHASAHRRQTHLARPGPAGRGGVRETEARRWQGHGSRRRDRDLGLRRVDQLPLRAFRRHPLSLRLAPLAGRRRRTAGCRVGGGAAQAQAAGALAGPWQRWSCRVRADCQQIGHLETVDCARWPAGHARHAQPGRRGRPPTA